MQLYLDTGNVEEIRAAAATGMLSGVTTNPTLIAKEGRDFKTVIKEIVSILKEYGDDFTVEDIIWTGPQPSLREQGAEAGVSNTFPLADLKTHLTKAIVQGRRIHYLPPYRGETKLLLADLLGLKPAALHDHKSVELMMAVAEMREKKGPEEIEELEKSFHIGYAMHTTAMKMCRPGIVELEIAGTVEGVSKAFGRGVLFPPVVS